MRTISLHLDFPGRLLLPVVLFLYLFAYVSADAWTPIVVKNIKLLGTQVSLNLTDVSRDGGHSVLLSNRIVWIYDDTECTSLDGTLLSFLSNTAAYASNLESTALTVEDDGVVTVGKNKKGKIENAILDDEAVKSGGWIPFTKEEADFNNINKGKERIAIWPGTAPTPVNRTHALLYAPIVHVNVKPYDPAHKYVPRGITLVSITAEEIGPRALRLSELLFPGGEVPFGGFAAVVGSPSLEEISARPRGDRDLYVLGVSDPGLQLARVELGRAHEHNAYSYWEPRKSIFTHQPPNLSVPDPKDVYLAGTYTSGNVFFSPYFRTFILVYFNKMVDSTFYIRFLDLEQPLDPQSDTWIRNGKRGRGIKARDVEALVRYAWSPEQVLYESPPGKGGFNYAGAAHPEYFNREYYPKSAHYHTPGKPPGMDEGEWYGSSEIWEWHAGGNGRHLMLSWTSQEHGGMDSGVYRIQLARVEFDGIPPRPTNAAPPDLAPANSTSPEAKETLVGESSGRRTAKASSVLSFLTLLGMSGEDFGLLTMIKITLNLILTVWLAAVVNAVVECLADNEYRNSDNAYRGVITRF